MCVWSRWSLNTYIYCCCTYPRCCSSQRHFGSLCEPVFYPHVLFTLVGLLRPVVESGHSHALRHCNSTYTIRLLNLVLYILCLFRDPFVRSAISIRRIVLPAAASNLPPIDLIPILVLTPVHFHQQILSLYLTLEDINSYACSTDIALSSD